MRYIITALAILLINGVSFSQTIRPEIAQLAAKLADGGQIMDRAVGEGGYMPTQYKIYEALCKQASDSELVVLTNDNSPAVQGYAFLCLKGRSYKDLFNILLAHLGDASRVSSQIGCMGEEIYIADFFINVMAPDYMANGGGLNKQQIHTIDSTLMLGKVANLHIKRELLTHLGPHPEYYDVIRNMATTEHNPIAAVALARFQKKEDIPIIEKFLADTISRLGFESVQYYGICAVRAMPVPDFFPFLKNIFEAEWAKDDYYSDEWPILYETLALYPTKETCELFERTINIIEPNKWGRLTNCLYAALATHPNPMFESIKGVSVPIIHQTKKHYNRVRVD